MGYLHPPPGDAPVIVTRDFGGDVREYAAMTTAYIRSGREVRLHECRSACTLALAAPNVCVYPNSVLRFHKAFNPLTRATNEDVSGAMLSAYPPAVRERLGLLSRQYKSLTGSELIRLGVRDCNNPAQQKILVARAAAPPRAPDNPLANAFSSLTGGFNTAGIPAYSGYAAPAQAKRAKTQLAEAAPAPAEPPRAEAPLAAATVAIATGLAEPPIPPLRPAELAEEKAQQKPDGGDRITPKVPTAAGAVKAVSLGASIEGAAPVLASARFAPFPYRLTGKS
jgi:hypothetical protein